MKTEKLNQWLTLIANFGVIAGIAFLAVEIRQNTEALHSESQRAIFAGAQQELYTSMQYPEIFRIMALPDASASFEQRLQMDSFLAAALRAREFAWRQYQAGLLDESSWATEREVISILVGSKRNRDWWQGAGRLQFTGDFQELVSEMIANEPIHPYWSEVGSWAEE
jgi:hypothetical protein